MKVFILVLCLVVCATAAFDFRSFVSNLGSRRTPTIPPTRGHARGNVKPNNRRETLKNRFQTGFNRLFGKKPTTAKPTTSTTAKQTGGEPALPASSTTTSTTAPPSTPPAVPQPAQITLSQEKVNEMRTEFRNEYINNKDMMIKMVQLGFHHCVGGCDGCLDLKHDGNKGLINTYQRVRNMHKSWEGLISLADYIVLGASTAAVLGVSTINFDDCKSGTCAISIPFTSGRKTCTNPDAGKTQSLPAGQDHGAPRRVLRGEFQLTETEMVALLGGGHSMGRCHSGVSGFNGPWDLHPDHLDNGYFKALTSIGYSPKLKSNGFTQWSNEDESLMMLHADMSLLFDYTIDPVTQQPSCTSRSQCDAKRSSTFATAERFSTAAGVSEFHSTFARAYEKMSNNAEFDPAKRQDFS